LLAGDIALKYQLPIIALAVLSIATPARADGEYPVSLECAQASGEIRIDGRFTDQTWLDATWYDGFRQSEPSFGAPATEKTSVAFALDGSTIYVAVRCEDERPDLIRATKLRHRDEPSDDDHVKIVFDTYLDQNRGVIFISNPLGAKEEGQVNGYRHYNWDWNEVWEVATAVTDDGWQAEFRIPLRMLRFGGSTCQEWGVNVQRVIMRKHEQDYLVPPEPPYDISSLNYAAKLRGLRLSKQERNLQIVPYAIAGTVFAVDEDTGESGTTSLNNLGFDMKYSLSSDLTLDATYNTDFSQVESDEEQVNLTRFSLFYPEKREFFLENAQLFSFGAMSGVGGGNVIEPFFSRRIGLTDDGDTIPIDFGLRLTGKVGRQDIGVLSLRTEAVGDLGLASGFYHVARVRRDLRGRSYVGGIATDSRRGGFHSSTFGVDGRWYLTPEMSINGYYLTVVGDGSEGDSDAIQARIDYTSDPFGFRFQWDDVGANFLPDLGYVLRSGFRKGGLALRRSIRPNCWGVRRVSGRFFYDWYTSTVEDVLESRSINVQSEINFENGDELNIGVTSSFERLFELFELSDEMIFNVGDYDFLAGEVTYHSDPSRRWGFNTELSFGTFYDGDLRQAGGGLFYNISRHFRCAATLSNYKIDTEHGDIDWKLWSLRLVYTFNSHLSASSYIQYNSSEGTLLLNFRLRLIHRNDSDLFIVYNELRAKDVGGWELHGRDSAVKANYRIFL
jgi:hypothetical protein